MKKSGHTDVASSSMLCKSIIEDANNILNTLPTSEAELPTWWTNKLAICYAYINSLRDYAVYQGFEEEEANDEQEDASESEDGEEGSDMMSDDVSSESTEMEDDMLPPSARMVMYAS